MKEVYLDECGIDSLPNLKIASKHGMNIFLTLNEGMLKDREELEKFFKIKIRSPTDSLK